MDTFYLGTHMSNWLGITRIPLCISDHRLKARKSFPRAIGTWMLDSGGFTVLSMYGKHITEPSEYVERVRRYSNLIGNMQICAIQDWMCEPIMLAKTGLTIREHQIRTVQSYCTLKSIAPDLPWMGVIQGWKVEDYLEHVQMYAAAGIDIDTLASVGVGSICRRQGTHEAINILAQLSLYSDNLHAFGMKITGLEKASMYIATADSMAWSFDARRKPPLPGHTHLNCANCLDFATNWYERVSHI